MGNAFAADSMPLLVTMVDVHNPRAQDTFYFCNVSSGGTSTKVIGRSQTLSVEVEIETVLSLVVYECPEPVFVPGMARCVGLLRIPVERIAQKHSSGIFQQWFSLDTTSDPREPAGDPARLASKFEQSCFDAVENVYQPKICLSVIGTEFEVDGDSRGAFNIFVGEEVKTQAGPDLKALIASHKQQAAYIESLHEELRRLSAPSYRPVALSTGSPAELALPRLLGSGARVPAAACPSTSGFATLAPQMLRTHVPAAPDPRKLPGSGARGPAPGERERRDGASPMPAIFAPSGWSTPPAVPASTALTPAFPVASSILGPTFGAATPTPPASPGFGTDTSFVGPAVSSCQPVFGSITPRAGASTPRSRSSSLLPFPAGASASPTGTQPLPAGAPSGISPRGAVPPSMHVAASPPRGRSPGSVTPRSVGVAGSGGVAPASALAFGSGRFSGGMTLPVGAIPTGGGAPRASSPGLSSLPPLPPMSGTPRTMMLPAGALSPPASARALSPFPKVVSSNMASMKMDGLH